MLISFDLDHTLFPHDEKGRREAECKLLSGDYLRKGSLGLLKELAKEHELWIYTTSFRKPWLLKLSFRLKGVKIHYVVNEKEHRQIISTYSFTSPPTKYPPHYNIDVHIDDSRGVLQEGEQFKFKVIQVDYDDEDWVNTLKQGLMEAGAMIFSAKG